MKLLFVLDNSYDRNGATQMLTRRLCAAIAVMGHQVDLLDVESDTATEFVTPPGVTLRVLHRAKGRQIDDFISPDVQAASSKCKIALQILCHPKWIKTAYYLKHLKRDANQMDIMYEIERLNRLYHYDVITASSAPHYTSFALSDAKVSAKKAVYFCDPYYLGKYFKKESDYLIEKKMYKQICCAFVSKFMYADYATSVFAEYLPKIKVLPFPGIDRGMFAATPAAAKGDKISCVFVGNFYWMIRRPDYLLKLFSAINHPNLQLRLVIGGPLYEFPEDYFDAYKAVLGDRMTMEGPLPYAQAFAAMESADVLINLGNTNSNMLPSKIFDYFSFCKPILNISSIADDPTLEYFDKYPLALTVFEQDSIADTAPKVQDFCLQSRKMSISFADVEALFRENTPASVATQFMQDITDVKE